MKNRNLHYMLMFVRLWWEKALPPRNHICRVTWKRIYKHNPVRDGFVAWGLLLAATAMAVVVIVALALDQLMGTNFTQTQGFYGVVIGLALLSLFAATTFNTALMEVSAFLRDIEEACKDLNMSIKEFSETANEELRTKAYSAMKAAAENLESSVNESTEIILGSYMTGNHMHTVFVGLGLLDSA